MLMNKACELCEGQGGRGSRGRELGERICEFICSYEGPSEEEATAPLYGLPR